MNPFKRFLAWRKARKEDREEIARSRREQLRAGEEAPPSMAETVEDAFNQYPPRP